MSRSSSHTTAALLTPSSGSPGLLSTARGKKRQIPQFFIDMHDDGSFRSLVRAGLEDGHAVVVDHFDAQANAWVSDAGLLHAWWFDRSHLRSISMGRALAVLDLLAAGDVTLPQFDGLASGRYPVVPPAAEDD